MDLYKGIIIIQGFVIVSFVVLFLCMDPLQRRTRERRRAEIEQMRMMDMLEDIKALCTSLAKKEKK